MNMSGHALLHQSWLSGFHSWHSEEQLVGAYHLCVIFQIHQPAFFQL
jgi:hypothetical protein